jgi:hypothetical protein
MGPVALRVHDHDVMVQGNFAYAGTCKIVETDVYKTQDGRNDGPSSRFSQLQSTMAALLSTLLAGSALLNVVNAQDFGGSGREEDAFSYVVSHSLYRGLAIPQNQCFGDAPRGAAQTSLLLRIANPQSLSKSC